MINTPLVTDYTGSWAIVVGINNYSNLSPLSGAVNDAKAVADLLQDEFRFSENQISLILNGDATQIAVREHLEMLCQQTKQDDRVIFFFAGHGDTRRIPSGAEIGYIATVESTKNQWHTLLKIDDITDYSKLIPAKHILYIFDACFSGLAIKRGGSIGIASTDIKRWIKDCMSHQARQVLTAGLAEQLVGDLTDDGHSIFTSHLLKALKGEAVGSEGEITASRVMAYVADAVMKDNRSEQTPAYGDIAGSEPGGDLIFRPPDFHYFTVPADREGGITTDIYLRPNDRISVVATGIISYDSGHHYTNADGWYTTYKGQLLAHPQVLQPIGWEHPEAYQTDGEKLGIIGSLFGWVGEYSKDSAFLIGESAEVTIDKEGYLHLSVNDAKTTYGDNIGEYEVTIRILG